jgi:hypothetical protein
MMATTHPSAWPIPRLTAKELQRLFARLDLTGPCWFWMGRSSTEGTVEVGEIPEGLELDHYVCDNPPCANPAHLKPSTGRENTVRGKSRQAQNARRTHCPRGHPDDVVKSNGRDRVARSCRECQLAHQRVYEQRPDVKALRNARERARYARKKAAPPAQVAAFFADACPF